jgi:hypothetical protein
VDGDPAGRDATDRVISSAAAVLRHHTPDADGWCQGCLRLWARLAWHPCEQAKWATAVHAAYTDPSGNGLPPASRD